MTQEEILANQQMLFTTVRIILDALQVVCILVVAGAISIWGFVGWDKLQDIRKRKREESNKETEKHLEDKVKVEALLEPTKERLANLYATSEHPQQKRTATYAAIQTLHDIEEGAHITIYRTCNFDLPDHGHNVSTIRVSIATNGFTVHNANVQLRGYAAIYFWKAITEERNIKVEDKLQVLNFNPDLHQTFFANETTVSKGYTQQMPFDAFSPFSAEQAMKVQAEANEKAKHVCAGIREGDYVVIRREHNFDEPIFGHTGPLAVFVEVNPNKSTGRSFNLHGLAAVYFWRFVVRVMGVTQLNLQQIAFNGGESLPFQPKHRRWDQPPSAGTT